MEMEVAIRHRRNTTSKPPDHTRLAHRTSETDRPKKGGRILVVAGDAAARQAGRPRRTPASGQRPPRRASAFSHFLSLPPLPPAADSIPRLSSRELGGSGQVPAGGSIPSSSLVAGTAAAAAVTASMATGAVTPPPLAGARRFPRGRSFLHRRLATSPMKDESVISTDGGNEETDTDSLHVARGLSHPGLSSSLSNKASVVPTPLLPSGQSDLRFNRLRPSIDESDCKYKRLFGCYVAREAVIDEEYWIAAWLRAEDQYENESGNRYVESFKRKFASKEFHALKKRCNTQHREKYICLVAVKNDDIRRTVLNSVVGTLDVCVRHPLYGEKFPEEPGKPSLHCRIYQPDQPKFGYVTNVCVAKYARRQGIASNMLLLAIDAAKLNGAENIYIHVHKDNLPAWRLYDQIGFKDDEGEDDA
ncbi:uncharacterized protein [Zea mays]|uniref:uncharacterized protein isoform X3 n=1 Tax=Zea mays TaxID=4577 RepID=UPI0016532AA3|nr:uncharacterized protein LOC118473416 isoform X3 [Zea mays]